MKNILIAVIVTAVVAGGAGYWYGGQHASAAVMANRQRFAAAGQNFAGGNRGFGGANGGAASGEVLGKDANGITLKLQDGGSRVVIVPASISVMKSAAGTMDDVTVGERVTVIGTTNGDGSITAQSIQVRPPMPSPSVTP